MEAIQQKTIENLNKSIDAGKIRQDFSILSKKVNGKQLIYLDSSATSLTPDVVVEAMDDYYKNYRANIHRATYKLGEVATAQYELARKKVADLINAHTEEIIFTSGTTASLNSLAYILTKDLYKGEEIVLTEMEHHSNLVPWQQLAKEKGLILKFIPLGKDGRLDMVAAERTITHKTKIVSATHVSNVLGTINDVKTLSELAHHKKAVFIIDGAQSVTHMLIDVNELGCDFFAFSGHKLFGPTGIGVLYGKKEILEEIPPFLYGGGMISEVTFKETKWNEVPLKFEAGTPNIAGAIGLGAAIDYIKGIGIENINLYIQYLTSYALKKLSEVKGLKIYGPKDYKERAGIISFNIGSLHPHDISQVLDQEGIAIRGGHMCAMPLVKEVLGLDGVCRISLQIYNTKEEVDSLVIALRKTKGVFKA